jgi:hypothetical protein
MSFARDFWGHGGDNDPIAQKVDEAIAGLKGDLLPLIRADYGKAKGRA